MPQSSQNILCPYCNVAVKEYHRHCPYCGRNMARKINIKTIRLAWWKAALIGLPFAALLTIYIPLDNPYIEYTLPLLFITSAVGLTIVAYLLANIILYTIHWIKYR